MEDTSRENRELVHDIVMSRSVEERFLMCAEMYETARELARIGMPKGLTPHEEEQYVFMRIHGMTAAEMVAK